MESGVLSSLLKQSSNGLGQVEHRKVCVLLALGSVEAVK